MARPVDQGRRDALVRRAADDLVAHGASGATLERLARATGTSARMLVHHFGSRDELITRAIATAREDQLTLARQFFPPTAEFVPGLAGAWEWLASQEARAYFRLFGELAARARLDEPGDDSGVRHGLTRDWLQLFTEGFEACAYAPGAAATAATELLALVRGLVLDLEATDDVPRIETTYRRCAGRLVADGAQPSLTASAGPRSPAG